MSLTRLRTPAPWWLALLVVAVYLALAVIRLHQEHWDPSSFVFAGDHFVDRSRLPAHLAVIPRSDGYDGQYYYRLALDPFTAEPTKYGITLDQPAYRQQRIGYPFLAWITSQGSASALPWIMIALNLAGLGMIAVISAKLAITHNMSVWWGLLPSLYPGFLLTLMRDTTEIVAVGFALGAVYFAFGRAYWQAAALATAAALTRETTILYLLGFGVAALVRTRRERKWSWDVVPIASPLALLLLWQRAVSLNWHVSQFSKTAENIGLPLVGLTTRLYKIVFDHEVYVGRPDVDLLLHIYYVVGAVACVVIMAVVGSEVIKSRTLSPLAISWCLYAIVTLSFSAIPWIEPWAYLRDFADCYVVGAVLLVITDSAKAKWVAAIAGLMWLPTLFYVFDWTRFPPEAFS